MFCSIVVYNLCITYVLIFYLLSCVSISVILSHTVISVWCTTLAVNSAIYAIAKIRPEAMLFVGSGWLCLVKLS